MAAQGPIMNSVADDREKPTKTLEDRIKDAVEGILDSLSDLLTPPPELIPVPRPARVARPVRRGPRRM